jgi:hypothetical protein
MVVFKDLEGLLLVFDEGFLDLVHFAGFNDLDGDGFVLFVVVG